MEAIQKRIEAGLEAHSAFVIYRKPGEKKVISLFRNDRPMESQGSDSFVFTPFDGQSYELDLSDCDRFETNQWDAKWSAETPELSFDLDQKLHFESIVAKAVDAIKEGRFDKVVLSRKEVVTLGQSAFEIFSRLLSVYPNAFVSLWNHPETGCWIGATPERLLKGQNKEFQTMALAGTQQFQGDESVEWPKKEREEQRLVTDYIWNTLEPLTQTLVLSEPHTHRAGNLLHIKTDISGQMRDATTLGDLAKALHPTPAVCGLPKENAILFIKENEGYDREFYSGFLGERGENHCDLFVNLRCMKISNGQAELFMGCGITAESNPEKEFFETVNKSLTMKRVLKINS
ncbi:chorismate-binding protein [Flavobacterium silvaticum]|uniref:isochorismate synthase n=1 Tax=Flavobacterium silvaticum TaxID=1852020 RepID=A0A972FJT3_9FLAO|nr:chorismate-binding protein [Flavobacterium silvaticum]NMH27354.1 chorismate-binding protein [Flavobacterium silvaticum]